MKEFFLFLFLSLPLYVTADQCYYPDGLVPAYYTYVACASSVYSSCCVPSDGDVCLSNGLCYYPQGAYAYRGACTDISWSSDACPKYCVTEDPTDWQELTSCGAGNYCCTAAGGGGTCCTNSTGVFSIEPWVVINDFGQTGISIPGTATATPSSSTTSVSISSSSTPSTTPTPAPSKNNTKAIAIGVSVGVCAVLILFALLSLFLYRIKRGGATAKQKQPEPQQQVPYPSYPPQQQPYAPQQPQQPYISYPPPQQQQVIYSPTPTPAPPYNPQQGGDKPMGMVGAGGLPEAVIELDAAAGSK